MPKYLVTATALRRTTEADIPRMLGHEELRTFSFEVSLDAPWSAKNSQPVNDLAFQECHRAFGWWPEGNPQVESVLEISSGLPEDLRSRLFASALMDTNEVADLLVDLMNWDEQFQAAQAKGLPQSTEPAGNPETLPPDFWYDDLV